MILEIHSHTPQGRRIDQVVKALKNGGIICYPTDTVYGIGCDMYNQKAVKRIHELKRRPKHKPFSFLCSDLRAISDYGHVSNSAYRLMKKCLPGPYTFVLPGTKLVPKIMMSKQKTVGIRVPDHPICQAIVSALGNPIVNTSAVLDSDTEAASEAFMVEELFGNRIDLVIDGGTVYPEPSTVVDLTTEFPEVLRKGLGDVALFK